MLYAGNQVLDNVEEIRLRGVNRLGPIHEGREILIKLLKKRVVIKTLLLNPKSTQFNNRLRFFETRNGIEDMAVHKDRLYSEYNTVMYILRDVAKQVEENANNLKIKLSDTKPEYAITACISDRKSIARVNVYSDDPEKGSGRSGYQKTLLGDDPEFRNYVEKRFESEWQEAGSGIDLFSNEHILTIGK